MKESIKSIGYVSGKENASFINLILICIYVGMKTKVQNLDAHKAIQCDNYLKYAVSFPADILNDLMVFYD